MKIALKREVLFEKKKHYEDYHGRKLYIENYLLELFEHVKVHPGHTKDLYVFKERNIMFEIHHINIRRDPVLIVDNSVWDDLIRPFWYDEFVLRIFLQDFFNKMLGIRLWDYHNNIGRCDLKEYKKYFQAPEQPKVVFYPGHYPLTTTADIFY